MSLFSRFPLAFKALHELGPHQMGQYALYQIGLRTGGFQRQLSKALARLDELHDAAPPELHHCLPDPPERQRLLSLLGPLAQKLLTEADEIRHGYVRLFGGPAIPLELAPPKPLLGWHRYERGDNRVNGRDIKFIWEAGRFGWAYKLALAYHLTANERYAETFWEYTEAFLSANPPYRGPHWYSAQEVAIRLVAMAFLMHVFSTSQRTTPERIAMVAKSIAIHAERIPPTLAYARSQNNNHLITEALGLYTASAVLLNHPLALTWHTLGWDWLVHAFTSQVSPDGTYVQHSTNYHRLMLQSALWAYAVHEYAFAGEQIPATLLTRWEAATRWLWKLVDPQTGHVPNLGHNDGTYLLPLTACLYADYRPVVHAAARSFLGNSIVPHGHWDDMSSWLCPPRVAPSGESPLDTWHKTPAQEGKNQPSPYLIINHKNRSWGTLRVAGYHSRPAHADQLHLDLWWRGLNIAQDPGTYLYNAPPPWENSLTSAFVHNTVTIDGKEFMSRAGRFLFLDWAQGSLLAGRPSSRGGWESLNATHNGYRKLGITHSRMVTAFPDGRWEVVDLIDGPSGTTHTARLHWLLPDWKYEFDDHSRDVDTPSLTLSLLSPHGWIRLRLFTPSARWKQLPEGFNFQLARAGEVLHGPPTVAPITGWTSPTYGDKIPALACIVEVTQALPIDLKSEWTFPDASLDD